MATTELTLELIANGPQQEIILPISAHVHKYKERFIYNDRIDETSTPIAYYESIPLSSWENLQIVDRTHLIAANTFDLVSPKDSWAEVTSKSFSSAYKYVAITNKAIPDGGGKLRPLFSIHRLPANTIEVSIDVVRNGVVKDIEGGYLVDLDNSVIYTNYKNEYNYDDGSYILYYVSSVDSDGEVTQTLLSPEPAAREATWEDVDLATGKLNEDLPLFTREKSSSGYTFYMNTAQTYYVRVLEDATIKALRPAGVDPTEPWNLRFRAGDFSTTVNGRFRRYWLPEFAQQAFQPSYPFVYSPFRRMTWVNRNTLRATRQNLNIEPIANMNLTVYVYDEDEVLRDIYTTDETKAGERYVNGEDNIEYDIDAIASWDNVGGFIQLGIEVDPNWTYFASFFYEARDYEYQARSLSPLQDKSVINYMWVYYMVPDADDNDQAIHLLAVDSQGFISSCTQTKGRSYPNLSLRNPDGTYNEDTVVGKKYRSAVDLDTFVGEYTAQYDNDYAYYILAEVLVMDTSVKEDSFVVDVKRQGATFTEENFEVAITKNPRILQSIHGYGDEGQEIPNAGSYIIHWPVSLLEDYGGYFSKPEVAGFVRDNLPVYTFPVLFEEYPKVLVDLKSTRDAIVDFKISWEGPLYSYNVYRKLSAGAEWEFLKTIDAKTKAEVGDWPDEGPIWIDFTDEDLESGTKYYYTIRVQEGSVEYPGTDLLSVKAR